MRFVLAEDILVEIDGKATILSKGAALFEQADHNKITNLYKILARAQADDKDSVAYIVKILNDWVWPRLQRSDSDELLLKIADTLQQKSDEYKDVRVKSNAYAALAATLDDYRAAVSGQSADTEPEQDEGGQAKRMLAIYGPQGYQVIHADDKSMIDKASSTIPNVSRGSRWSPYVKEVGGYTIGAAPTYGQGAGGGMPFILVATSDGDLASAVEFYNEMEPDVGMYPFKAHAKALGQIAGMAQTA